MPDGRPVDVAIIGAGMVGVSIALHVLERGLTVTVFDPGDPTTRASYGNAGAISRGSLFPVASPGVARNLLRYALNRDPGVRIDHARLWRILPWLRRFLKAANADAWRASARALDPFVARAWEEHVRLATAAGARHLLERRGWMKLYRTEEAFAGTALERSILAEHGVQTDMLGPDEVRAAEPALRRPFARALLFPETGHAADPGALLEAYADLARARGARFEAVAIDGLAPDGAGWSLAGAGRSYLTRQVVIAAGAWAGGLMKRLGQGFPMAAERGYHRHFATGDGPALTRTIYDVAGGYVAAPMRQGLRILSGVELAPRDAPADPRQLDRCVADARGALNFGPALDAAPWVGSRPSTPDGLPIIGPATGREGLFLAFGHGHIGFSTGPVTGRIVADLLTGRESEIPIAAFGSERFAR